MIPRERGWHIRLLFTVVLLMTGVRVKRNERFAQICFDQLCRPRSLRYVEQQSNSEPDFEVVSPGGHLAGVLEVTSSADPVYTETLEALGPRRHGAEVEIVECRGGWRVWPDRATRVKYLHERLDEHLAQLERVGIVDFDGTSDHPKVVEIRERLRLVSGRMTEKRPGSHIINLPGLSETVCPDVINELVRAVASRPDNRNKLSNSHLSERHLFVYVDISSLAAGWLLGSDYLPDLVTVDDVVTHVWVGQIKTASSGVVLHAANRGPWSRDCVSWAPGALHLS